MTLHMNIFKSLIEIQRSFLIISFKSIPFWNRNKNKLFDGKKCHVLLARTDIVWPKTYLRALLWCNCLSQVQQYLLWTALKAIVWPTLKYERRIRKLVNQFETSKKINNKKVMQKDAWWSLTALRLGIK